MASPRVAAITLHRVHNFGSVLQAYATQQLLEEAGAAVEIVDYWRPTELPGMEAQMRYNYARWNRNFAMRYAYWAVRGRSLHREHRNFSSFVESNIGLTDMYGSLDSLASAPPQADVYCVGSDQVWNSEYNVAGSEPFFLDFAPEGSTKISFSSSFGKRELTAAERELVQRHLGSFSAVSVREQSAVEALASLGVEATHVLDPTLGLPGERWLPGGDIPVDVPAPYVFVYQLHRNSPIRRVVEEIARRRRLNVVVVRGFRNLTGGRQRDLSNTPVAEFLHLIRGAAYVVTDSFHGTAFSLNFGKPFNSVFPSKYSERIASLLVKTGTEERAVPDELSAINDGELDVAGIGETLDVERSKMRLFLTSALQPGVENV